MTASETVSVELINDEERVELLRLWAGEDLRHERLRVLAFVREQHTAILELAAGHYDAAALSRATRRLIATLRTIHHQSEMQEQMREIHNEIWFCGQRGRHDHDLIKLEWVNNHGLSWRRWLIKRYLFVTEQCAAEISTQFCAS